MSRSYSQGWYTEWIVLLIYSNYLSTLQLWARVIPRVDIQNGLAQDRVTDLQ